MWQGPPHIQIWITAFARPDDGAAHSLPPDRPATQRLAAPATPARITCRRVIDIVFSCAAVEQKPEVRRARFDCQKPVADALHRLVFFCLLSSVFCLLSSVFLLLASCF
jgi:hypothetical protein